MKSAHSQPNSVIRGAYLALGNGDMTLTTEHEGFHVGESVFTNNDMLKRGLDDTEASAPPRKQLKPEPSEKSIVDEELRGCFQLLQQLTESEESFFFLEPVDWKTLGLEMYPFVIKTPMDLGTIKEMLFANSLANPEHFAAHVRLVFDNAKLFNADESVVFVAADNLLKKFNEMYTKLVDEWKLEAAKQPPEPTESELVQDQSEAQIKQECEQLSKNIDELRGEITALRAQLSELKKSQRQNTVKRIKLTRPKPALTYKQKEELCGRISELPADQFNGLLEIIQSNGTQVDISEGVLEIEVESLDDWTLRNVHKYVNEKCRQAKATNRKKNGRQIK